MLCTWALGFGDPGEEQWPRNNGGQGIGVQAEGPLSYSPESPCFSFVGCSASIPSWPCWMQKMQCFPAPPGALIWKDCWVLQVGMECLCLVLLACVYLLSSANTPTLPENLPSLVNFSLGGSIMSPIQAKGWAGDSFPASQTPSPYKSSLSGD